MLCNIIPGALTNNGWIYAPETLRNQMISLLHNTPVSGHFADLKTAKLISRDFYSLGLVLATGPGYPAAVCDWIRTGQSSPGCYLENSGTRQVWGRVRTGPRFHFPDNTTLAPIQYFNSHRIATWSIHEMCRLMPYFISHSQIWDQVNMHWVALEISRISPQNDLVFIATQPLLIRLQLREWEMKEGIQLHMSRIDYVVIRWELQFLIGARHVDFGGAGFVWKPVATVRFRVGTGPRTEPGIWTRC